MAEPGALGGPLDQAWDVGEHHLAVLDLDRPQHRRERRERIVGHLRVGPGQPPQQRGLARVGQPDQADVGEQLQPQLDPARLARGPLLGEARRLPGRGGEALVAVPAAPAVGDDHPLPGLDQIDPAPVHGLRLGPGRHRDLQLLPARPVPVRPFPVPARARPGSACSPAAPPGRGATIADQHHVPAVPAVAAIRAHRAARAPRAESSRSRCRRRRPRPRSSPCRTSQRA